MGLDAKVSPSSTVVAFQNSSAVTCDDQLEHSHYTIVVFHQENCLHCALYCEQKAAWQYRGVILSERELELG